MTSAIVTAFVCDVLALSLVRIAQLLLGAGPMLAWAGTSPGLAPRWNDKLDRAALMLSLLAGLLILAWLWLG